MTTLEKQHVAAFEGLIVRAFEKHGADGLTFRQVRQYVNPEQKKLLGGFVFFFRAWWRMIETSRVLAIARAQRSMIYGLQK